MAENTLWAARLKQHLTENCPDLLRSLIESEEWDSFSKQIVKSAEEAYQKQIQYYISTGSNEKTAKAFANSDIMREFILPVGINNSQMDEEPEEEIDPDYLLFLDDISE